VPGGGTSLTAVAGAGATTSTTTTVFEVALTNGEGTAVWEIQNTNTIASESVDFGVFVAAAAGAASIPTGQNLSSILTVTGHLAPVSDPPVTTTTTSATPIPRFVLAGTPREVSRFILCVTNLLFPFVTNQGGFDTGIAVINTSLDEVADDLPFNNHAQSGTCTFYFFGVGPAGGAAPAPQTSAVVNAGSMVAFSLQGGTIPGGTGTSNFQGFQGYVIARCNFQLAHGFAFVTRVGVSELAHGYLALVMFEEDRFAPEMLDN
jgi:hypothetical protein